MLYRPKNPWADSTVNVNWGENVKTWKNESIHDPPINLAKTDEGAFIWNYAKSVFVPVSRWHDPLKCFILFS